MGFAKQLGVKESDFRLIFGRSKIDYDPKKDESNRKKHGFSLESAVHLLQRWLLPSSSPQSIINDSKFVAGEIRHEHMGVDHEGKIVFMVTTMRPDETVRVISFRRANREEREIYFKCTGFNETK